MKLKMMTATGKIKTMVTMAATKPSMKTGKRWKKNKEIRSNKKSEKNLCRKK